ncbi:MAG: hypothetical protein JW745_09675 [Sedimentisphaerales bacterium]|nr:hypothetical protein [Sedimentisphaerales bacterium]MBN2842157.1 hypothetical protein [Sedimentisphaerales bacterium]
MIVKMSKIQVVVAAADKDLLLKELHNRGVLHIVPVDPAAAMAEEQLTQKYQQTVEACHMLEALPVEPQKSSADVSAVVEEIISAKKDIDECNSKTASLKRQLDNQRHWGDLKLADIDSLKKAGVLLSFFVVPEGQSLEVAAEFVTELSAGEGRKVVAVVSKEEIVLPQDSKIERLSVPETDNPEIKDQLLALEARHKKASDKIAACVVYLDAVKTYLVEMAQVKEFSLAGNSAFADSDLFAIQGWIPAEQADGLTVELEKAGIHAGARTVEPAEGENPPTKVQYPEWTRPIKALFEVLGTLPGYNELELSPFFMVAFPLFAAMIIGDAGYGLLFTIISFGMSKKLNAIAGRDMTNLVKVVGVATLVWGLLSGNIFGITPAQFYDAQTQQFSAVGKLMNSVAFFWDIDSQVSIAKVTKLSFLIGCVHLVLAHFCQLLAIWPDRRAFAECGWIFILLAMLGIIWSLFYPDNLIMPVGLIAVLLTLGFMLAVAFSSPNKNILVRLSTGFASSLLPTIGAFGDTMSYIRLMAVGLASYYMADSFNGMGAGLFEFGFIGWILGAVVIFFGHALNIVLCLIAVLAHGVRLNMLEFSGGAGIQWGGYAYKPFGNKK